MPGAPSNASPLPPGPEAVKAQDVHPQPIQGPAPEAAGVPSPEALARPAEAAAVPPAGSAAPGVAAAQGASQDGPAPSSQAEQAPEPDAAPPEPASAPGPAAGSVGNAKAAGRQDAPAAASGDARQAGSEADGVRAPREAPFEPDEGAIESLDSVHHAILNAAMMNKGMTAESRDDINMALDSRWKDPGDPHAAGSPGAELPDSMLPKLKEVLPYIDFIARKQDELEAAISERNSADDAGAKLRALGQSIRETAEFGVSKGIAERDYVPTQITVNEPAPDPSDPFAGGSGDVLERAGDEERDEGSAGEGGAQDHPAPAQEPVREAGDAGAAGFGAVPSSASAPAPASASAQVLPPAPCEAGPSHDEPREPAPAIPGSAPHAASAGGAGGAWPAAPDAQPPLSASEIEKISRAASEDLSSDQEDAVAPGPMMFGPGEGFVEGRRPGESVQDMLARVQKAAMAQLEAEDHGEAGLGAAGADLGAAGQAGGAQDGSQGNAQAPGEPRKAETAGGASHESRLQQEAAPSGEAPRAQALAGSSPAPGLAGQGPAAIRPPVQQDAPVKKHGLRLVADPFSDDLSEIPVEPSRPHEDLAAAEAEYAASAHPAAARPGEGQGSGSARPGGRGSAAIPSSLKQALSEIEGGSDASLGRRPAPANGQAAVEAPAAPDPGAGPAPSPAKPSPAPGAPAQARASSPAPAQDSANDDAPAPFEPPAPDIDYDAAQDAEPPGFSQYAPPDDGDEPDDEDDAPDGFQEASQDEAAVAAFEGAQDSRVAQGVGEQAGAATPEPLPDGDPASMPPAQRAELERIERIEAGQQVRPLIAQDFMPYVRKADPWLRDIEAAGYKDALYSALISSARLVDPNDSSHWILTMSERFSYFINDPSFSHNLETKFSFMRNGRPIRITIEQCEGLPQGCPLALASKALRDETQKARSRLSSFKPFTRILRLAGADFNNVPITLYGSAAPKASGKGGSGA